ncbi:MAG: hypothetical protein U0R80_17735 [Nocardioidaceae bacterium]
MRRRLTGQRHTRLVALVATAVLALAGTTACEQQVADDRPAAGSEPAGGATASPAGQEATPLTVSGSGVEDLPFGADVDEVLNAVAGRFGGPDFTAGPEHYFRIEGSDDWFEVQDDPISPSWQFPMTSLACWAVQGAERPGALCLVFGGDDASSLRLRGWELSSYQRWPGFDALGADELADVRLADTGIGLGAGWKQLRTAYPDIAVHGAEGASLGVQDLPWDGISDGVAAWRLSGTWNFQDPTHVPRGAVVTRLSAGDGPEPGCC